MDFRINNSYQQILRSVFFKLTPKSVLVCDRLVLHCLPVTNLLFLNLASRFLDVQLTGQRGFTLLSLNL